jgi:hypothetical protein
MAPDAECQWSFTYTPTANYNGPDSFTYKAKDEQCAEQHGHGIDHGTAVNDAPVRVKTATATNERQRYRGSSGDVLAMTPTLTATPLPQCW